jgi:hypothetical protein
MRINGRRSGIKPAAVNLAETMEALLTKIHALLTPQRLRYPYFIGAAMWLGWIISILLGSGNTDAAGHLIGTDYVAFYTAGKILQMGQSPQLYDLALAHQIQQPLYGTPSDNFNPYLNPPFYAWLFIPFAAIPYPWSPWVWMALNFCFLWWSLRLLTPKNTLRTFLLALTWQPAFAAISFGQNAFLSLWLLCLTFILVKKERYFLAGIVAGLLLYKPQLLLGLGFLWILQPRKSWRIFAGMALTAMVLVGGSFLMMPEATWEYFLYTQKIASNLMTVPGFPIWNAHSVQAFWLGLFPGQVKLAAGLHGILLIGGLWLFLRHGYPLRNNAGLIFSAAICLTLWITPYIMIYDWVLLLIPSILFWQELPDLRNALQAIYAVVWGVAFFSSALTFAQVAFFGRSIQVSILLLGLVLFTLARLISAQPQLKARQQSNE